MTPSTAALVSSMMKEIFPDDLVAVAEGGVEVSQELLRLPFDHIFFTGSPAVGKIVMRAASDHLSSVTLELGGKSPAIIDASANLSDAARRIAFGKFMNNGQTCIAPDYLLVDNTIIDKFLPLLKAEILRLFGNGNTIDEQSPSYSRVVNRKHYDRLERLLNDAIRRGATEIALGSKNDAACFMAPVLLTHVPADAAVLEEEIFGPVLPILTFSNRDEVVNFVCRRPKPLALYIFSERREFREYILSRTSAGGVCINECLLQFTHPNLPFGGVNNSGQGKSHGYYGFLAFSNEKPVLRQKNGWAGPYLLHPPYTKGMKRIVDLLLRYF
jgi:aldehyde dehydrogenase (NAD+)